MSIAADPRVTRAVNRAARRQIAQRFGVNWRAPFVASWRLARVLWWLARGTARVASTTIKATAGTRRRGARGI